jgi:hypothetical protein
MKVENAAGRKTDRFERASRRYQEQLETQLELLTGVMRGSAARADAVDDGEDEYGHRRDSHIGQAVRIGAVSAQIVVALSKLGGEFNHNINVKHAEKEMPDNSRAGRARAMRRLEEQGLDETFYEVPRSSSHPPLDRALKEYHAERDAELAAEAAAAAELPEGTPS